MWGAGDLWHALQSFRRSGALSWYKKCAPDLLHLVQMAHVLTAQSEQVPCLSLMHPAKGFLVVLPAEQQRGRGMLLLSYCFKGLLVAS